jgi:ATP-binding cassette subfamily F protein uup
MIQAHQLSIDFGFGLLLDAAGLVLEPSERVCLVGRNGQGKTTLMKILAGQQQADSGQVVFEPHTRIAYLPQTVPQDLTGSLLDVVLSGVDASASILRAYEELSVSLSDPPSASELDQLQHLQDELDRRDGWGVRGDAEAALSRLNLSPELRFEDLSGGRKRQCLLIRALVSKPHLLMLDEPTNHLDIEAINWLEDLLKGFAGSVLFVTHDRAFLRSVATRILDLDRGQLTSYPGDFDRYQERKQAVLDAESKAWSEFDKKLAKEEVWIRQGIKARRTRNEGRVRALKRLRDERKQRRERIGSAKIVLQQAGRSGKRVIAVESLGFAWPDQEIVSGFDLELHSGDRLGIIGPNGCGKTTLLRLLLGELEPQSGVVHLGTKLEPIYFDQLRNQLDDDKTVHENLCDDSDTVFINGKPKHVISYLGDFLFSPERARSSVKVLSGGERNRLLLAKLFIHEANLLVLDEPTNDLDTETLELLETTLLDYSGSLIVVSHDREFLNNVVTSCVAFDADGTVGHYVGGYDDWLAQRPKLAPPVPQQAKPKAQQPKPKSKPKLSFTQRHELDELPAQIEALESEQKTLNAQIMSAGFYDQPAQDVRAVVDRLERVDAELLELYSRWETLDDLSG